MKAIASTLLFLIVPGCLGLGGGSYTPIRTAFNRGVYHFSNGEYEAAITMYREALNDDPLDHRARFNLGVTLEALAEQIEEGPGGAEPAKHLRTEAEKEYRLILSRRPDDLRASINVAAMEFERGEVEPAVGRLTSLIEKHPESVLPRSALASHFLRQGLTAEALRLLQVAQAMDPTDVGVNDLLGEAALAQGDKVQARAAFQRVLDVDPQNRSALLAMARIALEAGDDLDAIDLYRRVTLGDPGCHEAHLRLSELYGREGRDLEVAATHLWSARNLQDDAAPEFRDIDYRARALDLYRRLSEMER